MGRSPCGGPCGSRSVAPWGCVGQPPVVVALGQEPGHHDRGSDPLAVMAAPVWYGQCLLFLAAMALPTSMEDHVARLSEGWNARRAQVGACRSRSRLIGWGGLALTLALSSAYPAPMESQAKAVCLLSGGMDSAVTLAEARERGFRTFALTLDYGQRHQVELEAAARVARELGATQHRVVRVDLSALGGSALTSEIEVPKGRGEQEIGTGVPVTYVPARNTIFLSIALGWAEILGARHLFLGANAVDYSGYPDCRPEFLRAFEGLAVTATAAGTEMGERFVVEAPLLQLSKAEIVQRARELGVDMRMTHTCYDPQSRGGEVLSCGSCDACILRLRGFRDAGEDDPLPYMDLL